MELAIVLALAASVCTATSSVCQRLGARHLEAGGSATRRAAFLGIATGISWGFIAAVIKELSSHVDGGPSATSPTGRSTSSWRRGRESCC